jgi:hypothetical protein
LYGVQCREMLYLLFATLVFGIELSEELVGKHFGVVVFVNLVSWSCEEERAKVAARRESTGNGSSNPSGPSSVTPLQRLRYSHKMAPPEFGLSSLVVSKDAEHNETATSSAALALYLYCLNQLFSQSTALPS